MRIFTIILFLGFLTISSCKTNEQVNNSNAKKTTDNYFSIYRSGCYGSCPSYKVEINRDGNFTYFGKSYVKNIGETKGTLTKEQASNLFQSLNQYNWNSYLEEYPMDNVDFPSFTIHYADGKVLKKIKGNSNTPKELKELTKKIDALMKSIGY